MLITKEEFRKEITNPEQRKQNLIFIGMSGAGKTHWSERLSEKFNLSHINIDKDIGLSQEFINLIKDIPGKNETEKMGNYFGKPWDKDFNDKEERYLAIEKRLMDKEYPLGSLIDTTGSSIYHPDELENLSKTGLVIYLETSEKAKKEMFNIYISDPKPVCWNGVFSKNVGENDGEALARCYPLLLEYRSGLYEKYADIKISYEVHKNLKSAEEFVDAVCEKLKDKEKDKK